MKKLSVVGIGPGNEVYSSIEARETLEGSDLIIGYKKYVELVEEYLPDKEYLYTGMTKEVDRCKMALEKACEGLSVAVVCSGDAGVYGMAGLVYELSSDYPDVEINVVPGISAVLSGSAVLGAPIGHDFAVISLSDRLTPWELIKKRASLAAQGDFVIALYNPKSKSRVKNIDEIHDILLQYKSPSTPVGIVKNASRPDEQKILSNLRDFTKEDIDMFSMVIFGNSKTFIQDGWMVTPRGYKV